MQHLLAVVVWGIFGKEGIQEHSFVFYFCKDQWQHLRPESNLLDTETIRTVYLSSVQKLS
jgi:hypothetical protein